MEIEEAVANGNAMQEEEQGPEFTPNAVPCSIFLISGKEFVVDDIMGWGYIPQGIFASGHFKGYTQDTDIMITWDRVDYIECNYDRLKKYMAEQAANADEMETDASSSA